MNKKIFINGSSAKLGGGKQILFSLTKKIFELGKKEKLEYVILVPNKKDFEHIKSEKITFINLPNFINKLVFVPFLSITIIPYLIKRYKSDILFNLGDIPVRTSCNQIMLFDWPYAIYNDPTVWKLMSSKEFITRKIKLFVFKLLLKNVNLMLAQTDVAKNRLKSFYDLKSIKIFPNSVALDHFDQKKSIKIERLSNKFSLLCLSAYYTHKNLEIFVELGELMKKNNVNAEIFLTIDSNQNNRAKKLLNKIKKSNLQGYITNLGSIKLKDVPSLYQSIDGLILTTLLESFSGTYVEAMWNKKIILTSKRDFAEIICGKNAYYFDPFDKYDIYNKITEAYSNTELTKNKVEKAFRKVNNMPNWETIYFYIINLFKESDKIGI